MMQQDSIAHEANYSSELNFKFPYLVNKIPRLRTVLKVSHINIYIMDLNVLKV